MPKHSWPVNSPNTLSESGHNEREMFSFKTNATDGGFDKRVCDKDANTLLAQILSQLGGAAGAGFFAEAQTQTTPGATQTLITTTVPASTTRSISKVIVVCRKAAKFEIKINSTIVGSGRTGPAHMQVEFSFMPTRSAVATDTIDIEFEQIGGSAVDVEAYLMATDT